NSSGVRLSRMTNFSPLRMRSASSFASISGTWCTCSTFSPKSLLGTLLPHSVAKPSVTQRLMPPSSTDTRRYPMRSTVAAASRARRPSSSHRTMGVSGNGTACGMASSSCRRAIELAPAMWLLLYSPASRTSINANGALPSSSASSALGVIVTAMGPSRVDSAPDIAPDDVAPVRARFPPFLDHPLRLSRDQIEERVAVHVHEAVRPQQRFDLLARPAPQERELIADRRILRARPG